MSAIKKKIKISLNSQKHNLFRIHAFYLRRGY